MRFSLSYLVVGALVFLTESGVTAAQQQPRDHLSGLAAANDQPRARDDARIHARGLANMPMPPQPDGADCMLDSECLSNDCIDGTCGEPPSTTTTTTTSSQPTATQKHHRGKPNGHYCRTDHFCQSMLCHHHRCTPRKPVGGECARDQCCLHGNKCVNKVCKAPKHP